MSNQVSDNDNNDNEPNNYNEPQQEPGDPGDYIIEATALLDRVQIAIEQGQPASALRLLGDCPAADLPAAPLTRYYHLKGWALLGLNQSEQAEEELNVALQLAEQHHERELAARIRNRIGISYYQRLQFAVADAWFVQCWSAIHDGEISDTSFKMHIHNNLGNTALRMGIFAAAVSFYYEALNHARNLNDDTWMGSICLGLSLASLHSGDYGVAMLAIKQGFELEQRGGSPNFLAHLQGMYAMTLIRLNQPQAAEQELYKAIKLSEQIGANQTLVIAYGNLAEAYMAQARLVEALSIAQLAVAEARRLQVSDLDLAQLLHTLANVYARLQEYNPAISTFEEAAGLMRDCGDAPKYAQLLFDYGRTLLQCGKVSQGISKLELANYLTNVELRDYSLARQL